MSWHRTGVLIGILGLGAGALAVAACASLLGIDDRSLDPALDGGASTDTSSGGSGGSGSSGTGASGSGSSGSGGSSTGSSGGSSTGSSGGSSTGSSGGSSGSDSGAAASSSSGASSGTDAGRDSQPVNQCPDPCVMANALNHPFQMTSDANRVYWTEFGDALGAANGYVKSCPLSGCGAGPSIYAQAQINPRGIAVDSQNVYWASATYGQVGGAIWSCAIGGCASPTKLAGAGIPFGVAVDSTYVYWVDSDDGSAHRIAKPNSGDAVLYDGGDYAGTFGIAEPEQCAADSAFVYLNDRSGDVYRIPTGGGNPVLMVTGLAGGGWPLAVDTSYVYYGESGGLFRIPKAAVDGGAVIGAGIADPDGIAVDLATSTIYWSDWGSGNADDGTVGKVRTDGTGKTVLASSLVTPEAVTVAGGYVFWLSNGTLDKTTNSALAKTGALMRMAK